MKCCHIILLTISWSLTSLADARWTYYPPCAMSDNNTKCMIQGLTIYDGEHDFVPVTNLMVPNSLLRVLHFEVTHSRIHTVGASICDSFEGLEEIRLSSVSLQKIKEDAFRKCKNLLQVDMSNNKLSYIGPNLFLDNWLLRRVTFKGNNLDERSLPAFAGLDHLATLDLSQNKLRTFPVDANLQLPALQHLDLSSNQLTELHTENIVKYCPRLIKIYLSDNHIQCEAIFKVSRELNKEHVILAHDTCLPNELPVISGGDPAADTPPAVSALRVEEDAVKTVAIVKDEIRKVERSIDFIIEQMDDLDALLASK